MLFLSPKCLFIYLQVLYNDNFLFFSLYEDEINLPTYDYLQVHAMYWIAWIKSHQTATHMEGVWKRQIKTIRVILNTWETFRHRISIYPACRSRSYKCKISSRPMTAETISGIKNDILLSPRNLLTMKSKVLLPPPGCF